MKENLEDAWDIWQNSPWSYDWVMVKREKTELLQGVKNNISVHLDADYSGNIISKYINIFYEENETPEQLTVYGYLR